MELSITKPKLEAIEGMKIKRCVCDRLWVLLIALVSFIKVPRELPRSAGSRACCVVFSLFRCPLASLTAKTKGPYVNLLGHPCENTDGSGSVPAFDCYKLCSSSRVSKMFGQAM